MSDSQSGAIELIKTSLAPRVFTTGPPNYYTQTSFPKPLDVTGNFVINDKDILASQGEKVPTQTGLIIWQPNRGAGSLYRFGIVPQGANVTQGAGGTRGLRVWPESALDTYFKLVYGSPTAVPYNNIITTDTVKIGPDLTESFSQVRIYSGDLRMSCDTVPIGLTALNGVFSAGAFSDTRDVSQVSEGSSNPQNCFAPVDLVQSSVTSKDGIKEVPCQKGIVSLVGSDIQPFYAPPNADETDQICAGWTSLNGSGFISSPQGTMGPGSALIVSNAWFSPWNVQAPPATNFANPQNFNMKPINLNGVVDFDVVVGLGLPTVAMPAGAFVTYQIGFSSIFVTCTSNTGDNSTAYACSYDTNNEVFDFIVGGEELGNAAQPFKPVRVSHRPRMYQTSLTTSSQGGMYLGTKVSIYCRNPTSVNINTGGSAFASYITYNVRARNIYTQGELGPTRVLRWDNLSDGQVVKIDGKINAQCIPEGTIAPFVHNSAMYSDTALNLNAITLLAELYNGDSPLRRNWTQDAYEEFMRSMFPNLSMNTLMSWKQPKLQGILSALMRTTNATAPQNTLVPGALMRAAGSWGATGGFHRRGRSRSKPRSLAASVRRKHHVKAAASWGASGKMSTVVSKAPKKRKHRSSSRASAASSHRSGSRRSASRRSGSRASSRASSVRSAGSFKSKRSGSKSSRHSSRKSSASSKYSKSKKPRKTTTVVTRKTTKSAGKFRRSSSRGSRRK